MIDSYCWEEKSIISPLPFKMNPQIPWGAVYGAGVLGSILMRTALTCREHKQTIGMPVTNSAKDEADGIVWGSLFWPITAPHYVIATTIKRPEVADIYYSDPEKKKE